MKNIFLALLLINTVLFSQNGKYGSLKKSKPIQYPFLSYSSKDWSKEAALFKSKEFLFKEVLGLSTNIRKFTSIPLASAKSDELTTLFYESKELNKSGMILGFYGNYWNSNGVSHSRYGFKDLPYEKAVILLNKIHQAMIDNKDFLKSNTNNNNVYFEFEDLKILIYREINFVIRIFWNGFDSTWENTAFKRSKKRFERKYK